MRTIRSALSKLGLAGDLLKHGIRREVYLAPLCVRWKEFLRGETDSVEPMTAGLEDVGRYYRERWAIPRARRRPAFIDWSRENMRLSTQLSEEDRRWTLF